MALDLDLFAREMHIAICCWRDADDERRAQWLSHFAAVLQELPGQRPGLQELSSDFSLAADELTKGGAAPDEELLLGALEALDGLWAAPEPPPVVGPNLLEAEAQDPVPSSRGKARDRPDVFPGSNPGAPILHRLLFPLAVTAALAAPALARTTKTDTVTASVHKTGRSGTALVYKGVVHSKVFGKGQVTEYLYGDLTGKFVIRYAKGVVRGRSVAHLKHVGNSGVDVTGTYKLTGGTKKYRHVSGHGTFTGHTSQSLQSASFRQRGKVSF
jgi:hypothetical protein